jgi:hypothetical protein
LTVAQIDPREARVKPGAPDYVRHIQDTTVGEERLPVADTCHTRRPLDAGSVEIGRV